MPAFPIDAVRARFPALARDAMFFDAPGGTQACDAAIGAMTDHLTRGTANAGGPFATSVETDRVSEDTQAAMADLLGAQPEEIAPAYVFFASSVDSSYITGEVLTLLGGGTTAG